MNEKQPETFNIMDLNFHQLVDWMTGEMTISLGHGEKLRSIIFRICDTTCRWHKHQESKKT